MSNGVGFHVAMKNEPSIYISGDTILTTDVKRALVELKPDIAVVACGNASLDIGQPILMTIDDILEFAATAPNMVIANHLESINHCPMTRHQLRTALEEKSLSTKTFIPEDGELILV